MDKVGLKLLRPAAYIGRYKMIRHTQRVVAPVKWRYNSYFIIICKDKYKGLFQACVILIKDISEISYGLGAVRFLSIYYFEFIKLTDEIQGFYQCTMNFILCMQTRENTAFTIYSVK